MLHLSTQSTQMRGMHANMCSAQCYMTYSNASLPSLLLLLLYMQCQPDDGNVCAAFVSFFHRVYFCSFSLYLLTAVVLSAKIPPRAPFLNGNRFLVCNFLALQTRTSQHFNFCLIRLKTSPCTFSSVVASLPRSS